ncbi:cytochrome P450 [Aspergillus tanneri]|uniref:Cytochrome P450 n=1 Tax=Aspergillus tanneri TaxID=1220188 RepID=A0A5M9MGS1_9EURO|nr:uncharacterized protein ATNIH1004_009177 [Aspergillus tanneri]KAA8644966.1 hypothetical protein ATNIH1004_009177 [Aspergillus tanneri]
MALKLSHLAGWIYERINLATHGWEFRKKGEIHRRLGKTFVLVTLDECSLWVAEPALGTTILQRRKDFVQPAVVARVVGIFGSNVLQSNGDDWQRQRRIVAPNLNERISETVWNESCQQAQVMIDYLLKHPGNQTLSGLRCLAINVIGAAGYGQHAPWRPDVQELAQGWKDGSGRGAYFNTIGLVADMFLEAAIVPTKLMKMWFMPACWQLLGKCKEKMPEYTKQVLDEERKAAKEGSETHSNLLSMLVRFSDDRKSAGSSGLSLTDDEISGNLFVFSAAGFDTTANTMGYAVMLLAAYPKWQDWLREELLGLDSDASTWQYEESFPKCTRTLALMFETLRLFTPVAHATRSVAGPQQLADDTRTHLLLPPMDVFVSSQSLHADVDIWGPDFLEFNPSRWIDANGQMITPMKGAFLPWSGGPRVCPGMKMSQVEFVSTIATLFRLSRCEPMTAGSGSIEDSCKRLKAIMNDSNPKLTLQVHDPAQVNLRWILQA